MRVRVCLGVHTHRSLALLSRGEVRVVVKQAPTSFQRRQRQSRFQRGVERAVASTGMTAQQLLDPWSEQGDAYVRSWGGHTTQREECHTQLSAVVVCIVHGTHRFRFPVFRRACMVGGV